MREPVVRMYSGRYVSYVIFLLAVANVFNYMDRTALSVLMPLIKRDLGLSDTQIGLLAGFAFFVFYAVCGIPIARWADRGVRRNIIAITLAVWSVMAAMSGAAQNFWQLLLARIGLGAGEAGCVPSAESMLCDYVPAQRRPFVYSVTTFGMCVGTSLGLVVASSLATIIGWRWTFVALGLPGVALAVVVWLTLQEPRRGHSDAEPDDSVSVPFGAAILTLWRCRTYRLLTAFMVANGFMQIGSLQWWPSFYTRVYGLSESAAGLQLGLATGLGMGTGLLGGGLLASMAARGSISRPLTISAAAIALSLPPVLGALFAPSAAASVLLIGLTGALWCVPQGAVVATSYGVVRPRMRATSGALTIFLTAVLGFGCGPLLVGVLSDVLSSSLGVQALRYALLAPICALPVMVALLLAAAKTLPQDAQGQQSDFEVDSRGARCSGTTSFSEQVRLGVRSRMS